MTAAPVTMRIDIVSDVVCPWCIIGWKRLAVALEELKDEVAAEVRWHPFELNPDMPPEGEDATAHVARKYGRTVEQAAAARQSLVAMGDAAGFDFRWRGEGAERPARMWNTFLAHKLLTFVALAGRAGAQHRLAMRLFAAHFQQRLDISSRQTLLDIAREPMLDLGVHPEELATALDDAALDAAVRAEEAKWRDANITGVPAYILDEKFMLPGAQEPEVFATIIRKIISKR